MFESPIAYIGSKRRLIKQLVPYFPKNIHNFLDTFCGSLTVSLNINAEYITCNDLCSELIDMYKNFDINYHKITSEKEYYDIREQYNKFKNPSDLFSLLRCSFNKLLRFNKNREFNAPFGRIDNTDLNVLYKFKEKIKNFTFISKDFRQINYDNFDFCYFDPPYYITDAEYNGTWTEECEIQLYKLLDDLNNKNVKFMLSNVIEHNGKTNKILAEWCKKYNTRVMNIDYRNCFIGKYKPNGKTTEIIVYNYDIDDNIEW